MEFERNALCQAWRMQGFKEDMPKELQDEIIFSIHYCLLIFLTFEI